MSNVLRDCAGYLLWAARLPCSQATLQSVIDEESQSDKELAWRSEAFTWRGQSKRLRSLLDLGAGADETPAIERQLEKAETLLKSYSDGTPAGKLLLDLISEILEATHQSRIRKKQLKRPLVTIAVPNPRQTRLVLAELFEAGIETHDKRGNQLIQIVRTAELFSKATPEIARRLIVIAARARTIAELVAAHKLPKRIELILSATDAERICKTLTVILEDSTFEKIHVPMLSLVKDLQSKLKADVTNFSILGSIVHWRPQQKALTDTNTNFTFEGGSPDFVLQLDGAPKMGVSKSQPVFIYDESKRPPFICKQGGEVSVGDNILIITDDMRSEIDSYIDSAGPQGAEHVVRKYHSDIKERLNARKYSSLIELVRGLRAEIKQQNPEHDSISESQLQYWVHAIDQLDQPIEELIPHAPRDREDFEVFTKVLGIDENISSIYWDYGISRLRTDRQKEGRKATKVYIRLLIDPHSVKALLQIPQLVVDRVLEQARMNVFEILSRDIYKCPK